MTATPEQSAAGGTAVRPSRDNSFDAVRLALALMVLFEHGRLLGGYAPSRFAAFCKGQTNEGEVAVIGFFGISGYLITQSYETGSSWIRFVAARALRILPGFYFALVFSAFLVAPLIAHFNPTAGPWQISSALRFVGLNAGVRIREWHVGAVTNGLPYEQSLDGSLWSLAPECACYIAVLLAGLAGWIGARRIHLLLFAVGILAIEIVTATRAPTPFLVPTFIDLVQIGPFVCAFATGSALYCFRESLPPARNAAIGWLLISVILMRYGGWALLGPVCLTLGIVLFALSTRLRLPVDLSYGAYVLHFPLFQLLSSTGLQRGSMPVFLAAGLGLTLAASLLSWYLIEKPFLRLKPSRPLPAQG